MPSAHQLGLGPGVPEMDKESEKMVLKRLLRSNSFCICNDKSNTHWLSKVDTSVRGRSPLLQPVVTSCRVFSLSFRVAWDGKCTGMGSILVFLWGQFHVSGYLHWLPERLLDMIFMA